jgi:hypothetical protein
MMLLVLILSTHNLFQDAAMTVLMATTLVACGNYLRSMQRKYRFAELDNARWC